MSGESRSTGILLVGHGTRDKLGTREFLRQTETLSAMTTLPVQPAFLEFQSPTIGEAWTWLASRGVRRILVTPLLLFAAGHAKSDIPEAIEAARVQTPEIDVRYTRPLSRCRPLVDRVLQCVLSQEAASLLHDAPRVGRGGGGSSFRDGDSDRCGLLMVGRGSHDPCARTDMRVLTELIRHRTTFEEVRTAFYAMAEPKLPEVLGEMAASGLDRILVHPHLLFHGRLDQAIRRQCDEVAGQHPNVKIRVGPYLGPTTEIAAAILHRLDQID